MVVEGLPKVFKDKRMIQKVLFLFRALPFAPVRGGGYPRELALGYPPPHTVAPARWQAEKKQNQKAAVGGKKSPAVRRNKNSCLWKSNPFHPIILVRVTPTAKRNSYRVATLVGRLPRVACFARNPGLGNRNSVRVARGTRRSPSPGPPQGAGVLSCCGLGHYNLL